MEWIPAFAGMTLLRPEATLGRQNGWTSFVIPDLTRLGEAWVGNPVFYYRLWRPDSIPPTFDL